MTQPAVTEQQSDPQSDTQQQNPSASTDRGSTPPWGEDFDPQRAWDLVQNLRGDKAKLKAELAQAAVDRDELEALRSEKLSADEKALKEATERAAADAKTAADLQWSVKYLQSELKSIAAQVITDRDQLTSFMAVTDPAKFAGDDGEIDESKVMGHLTAIFGTRAAGAPRNWGQTSSANGDPGARPGDGGRAEAAKRFGTKIT